eukprot:s956_g17.t1
MLGCVTCLYAGGSTACSSVCPVLVGLRRCVHLRLQIYAVLRCVTLRNVYAVARDAVRGNALMVSCSYMLAVLHHATLCDMFARFRIVMLHAMLAPLFNVLAGSRRYGLLRSATFRFACGSTPRYVV